MNDNLNILLAGYLIGMHITIVLVYLAVVNSLKQLRLGQQQVNYYLVSLSIDRTSLENFASVLAENLIRITKGERNLLPENKKESVIYLPATTSGDNPVL